MTSKDQKRNFLASQFTLDFSDPKTTSFIKDSRKYPWD